MLLPYEFVEAGSKKSRAGGPMNDNHVSKFRKPRRLTDVAKDEGLWPPGVEESWWPSKQKLAGLSKRLTKLGYVMGLVKDDNKKMVTMVIGRRVLVAPPTLNDVTSLIGQLYTCIEVMFDLWQMDKEKIQQLEAIKIPAPSSIVENCLVTYGSMGKERDS
jgi:hypothetical protein